MRMHVLCVCVTGGKGVVTVIIIHVEQAFAWCFACTTADAKRTGA